MRLQAISRVKIYKNAPQYPSGDTRPCVAHDTNARNHLGAARAATVIVERATADAGESAEHGKAG